ncbi:hypothetical protein TRFO_39499 [Tritrichomonas foetus]|uniref:Uncharacterized protein n=1 Tax=Tritrichomonas foetus TaxID=1144522 RepID=A0A1J4JAK5_9EUKA|nr:hypothetical protein TRFO_39499 [Tritrichomonas foetus]|eukprot:OHS94292.1 hypothetical protein TRFO_39499 [Tritrichomonas foetus]
MMSFDSRLRNPDFDSIDSTERQATYDRMARTLHHPRYRANMINHYDELSRVNRKFHDLNYPIPPPSMRERDIIKDMKASTFQQSLLKSSTNKSSSHLMSTDKKVKSMYMTSSRLMKVKQKNLKDQIISKAKEGSVPETEKIIAVIAKTLIENGIDFETVQLALENVLVKVFVDKKTSEFEIEINL